MATENKALTVKEEVLEKVTANIRSYQTRGELQLPDNYSVENAMKAAWLTLQSTTDRNNKPVLEVCSRPSIINALMSMAIQGLNPDKKQCYFIAYGQNLTLMRSYFGGIAVAKRVDPRISDVFAEVVYADDEFEYERRRGKTYITVHKSKLANVDKSKIVAAYAVVLYENGDDPATILTMDEIKAAWAQSIIKPINTDGNVRADTVHGKHTAEMCKRTVINRACKAIINASDDSSLFTSVARHVESELTAAEVIEEIEDNANGPVVDVPAEEQQAPDGQQTIPGAEPAWAGVQ